MLRKLLKLTGYLALIAFLVVTLSFSARETRNVTCGNIEIELREDEQIKISKDEISRLVRSADDQLVGKNLQLINADSLERAVEKHQAIHKAEIFKVITKDSLGYRGTLGVKIRHRKPVVRIMSSEGRYYLDRNSEIIPTSSNYTANVLVATGYFSEAFAKAQLLPFVLYIEEDPFWKAQIEQVHVESNGDVLLTPLVGNHIIEMGPLENYPEKLRNMKAFYQQVMAGNNWNKYQQLSVKYKNQVIAKKKIIWLQK